MTPPTGPDLEDLLRRTLTAEADRHPVRPDPATVRAAVDDAAPGPGPGVVVALGAAPRRTRARLLAAATVLAVVAATGVVVATTWDRGEEPVVATDPGGGPGADEATGWYLPGPGWTIEQVHVGGTIATPGQARQAMFMPAPGAADETFPQMDATVTRTTEPAAAVALVADREGAVWGDAGGVRYQESTGGSTPSVDVVVAAPDGSSAGNGSTGNGSAGTPPAADLVLRVRSFGMARDDVVAYAAAWGVDGALRTPDGMARTGDTTSTAVPVAPDVAAATDIGPLQLDGSVSVTVEVRSDGGQRADYDLRLPGTSRSTGSLPTDEALAAGLTEAELFVERPGALADATVWEVPDTGPGTAGFAAEAPGASIGVHGDDAAELLGSLRPVTGEEWAAALRDAPGDRVHLLLAATLADVRVTEDDFTGDVATATTAAAPPDEAPPATSTEPAGDTTTPGTAGSGEPLTTGEVVAGVVSALPPAGGRGPFADEVLIGLYDDATEDRTVARADLGDPDVWVLDVSATYERGDQGRVSMVDVVRGAGGLEASSPGPDDPRCENRGAAGRGERDPRLVVVEPEGEVRCADWFAVVVTVDEQGRITEVRLRLP